MRKLIVVLVLGLLLVALIGRAREGANSITLIASVDGLHRVHNDVKRAKAAVTVTCLEATGTPPLEPVCIISAPGVVKLTMKPGDTISTSGPGNIMLSCGGRAPLQCKAEAKW